MTKIEYNLAKEQILATYGKPENDFDKGPMNESAQRLRALRSAYLAECLSKGRKRAKDKQLDEIREEVPKARIKALNTVKLPIFEIDEMYLTAFTEQERKILHMHFNDNANKDIAIKFNISTQAVTGLLNRVEVRVLEARLFDSIGPWRNRLALLKLQESGDAKVVVRLGEHWGVIKSETKELNLNTKPLEDPKAVQLLKQLGDKLVDEADD